MTSALRQIALGVSDLDRAAAFYGETLGLPEIARFDPPGLAFFDLGGYRLLLERSSAREVGSAVLYFETDDIERRVGELEGKGVEFGAGPTRIHVDAEGLFGDPGVEEWMAFFTDPDGNALALVERRAPVAH